MGGGLSPVPADGAAQEELLGKLWVLLRRQAALYCGPDSTSLPEELLRELLESMLYTLTLGGGPGPEEEGEAALARGREKLEAALRDARTCWEALRREPPGAESVFYRETLTGLRQFFARYDLRFFAHQIPCAIDYPPLRPVPESLRGACWVEEYLRRLTWERRFLGRFDPADLARLYRRTLPDWREMCFSLCQPPLTNALGLALLGRDPRGLDVSPAGRRALCALLEGTGREGLAALLERAARRIWAGEEDGAAAYFALAARDLAPRLEAAAARGDLSCVFLTL